MKMRKLLPLILLAVGALFLLSSCDALLDAIYANNTIDVSVQTAIAGYQNSYSKAIVTLSGAVDATGSAYYDVVARDCYVPFTKLPNGDYVVTATFYGYSTVTGLYYASSPQSVAISMPYYGSNTASLTFYF